MSGVKKQFPQSPVEVKLLHDLYQADIIEMISCVMQNKQYKYLNVVINVFSNFGYKIPLKTKTGVEVSQVRYL